MGMNLETTFTEEQAELKQGAFFSTVRQLKGWAQSNSLAPLNLGLGCCAVEMMAATAPHYDLERFGSTLQCSPRQADCLIVSGTVTKKMAPVLRKLYDQMPEPKWVIAMGACAISGGPYLHSYSVVKGVDEILPVDVYVPGCPPHPAALIHGLEKLKEKIRYEAKTGKKVK